MADQGAQMPEGEQQPEYIPKGGPLFEMGEFSDSSDEGGECLSCRPCPSRRRTTRFLTEATWSL
jgi:hypothetical protein